MPTYSFACVCCGRYSEVLRPIARRDDLVECPDCKLACERIIVAPAVQCWNSERPFPNLSPHGDGTKTFRSKTDYECFLKERNIGESGINAPITRPHGNKVVMTDGRS